jgi:hypothetical protein
MRGAKLVAAMFGLVLGLALGWYVGFTRPAMRANRDARRYVTSMEHDDRVGVAVALAAIRDLEQQRDAHAKELLARQVASYYVVYGPPDDPKKCIPADIMSVLRKIDFAPAQAPLQHSSHVAIPTLPSSLRLPSPRCSFSRAFLSISRLADSLDSR